MHLHVLIASAVVVLAGLAVIGALALVIVWEWCAIRRIMHAHRYQPSHQETGAIRPGAGAKSMGAPGRWLLLSWLVAVLVMLSVDGRLPVFLAWTTPAPCWRLASGRWSASSGPPPSSTSHPSRIVTESPMTLASRSRP